MTGDARSLVLVAREPKRVKPRWVSVVRKADPASRDDAPERVVPALKITNTTDASSRKATRSVLKFDAAALKEAHHLKVGSGRAQESAALSALARDHVELGAGFEPGPHR